MADTSQNKPADQPLNTVPSSSEMSQMLGLEGHAAESSFAPATSPSPANLPIEHDVPIEVPIEVIEQHQGFEQATLRPRTETTDEVVKRFHQSQHGSGEHTNDQADSAPPQTSADTILKAVKKLAPYLVVFAIGVGLYFFYFNTFSFTSIFKGAIPSSQNDQVDNAALESLKEKEATAYNNWIDQFFFDVSDPKIIDMDSDVSGNGLTNFQKYLLNLNPKMYDTLGDGTSDGQKIIDGTNPWTGLAMTDSQKKIADAYFDNELINNRIAAAQANRSDTAFTPYVSNNSPYYQAGVSNVNNGNTDSVQNNVGAVAGATTNAANNTDNSSPDSVPVQQPANNNSVNANANQTIRTAPLTGVRNDTIVSSLGIDTAVPGVVNLPTLNTSVPVIWSKGVKDFDKDLKNGVVHYPGTPLPGEVGTSYISGHSSGYFWDKSQFKQAFAKLGNLKNGDSFTVTVTLTNGNKATLHYRVDGRAEYAANDQRQFLQSSDSVVALSTCWPINTTARRLVIYGVLTQIEK